MIGLGMNGGWLTVETLIVGVLVVVLLCFGGDFGFFLQSGLQLW